MNKSIDDKIHFLESQMMSKLSKHSLENNSYNFKTDQKINDSKIISLNTIPDNNRVHEEDTNLDFKNYMLKWTVIDDKIITSIACSETGQYQIITSINGGLYISFDYGSSWMLGETPTKIAIYTDEVITGYIDPTIYKDVAISFDGKYLTAVGSTGVITLSDYATSWSNTNNSLTNLNSITMSASGKIQYISSDEGIYISNDFGNMWSILTSNSYRIKCSGSGQYLVTSNKEISSIILYSDNYGANFKISDSPNLIWNDSKCSFTGQYQTAVASTGKIYISDNYGKNWSISKNNDDIFNCVTMSGSGKHILVGGVNVYISKDYGKSWRHFNINDEYIKCVNVSFDGKVALLSSDKLYSSTINSIYIKESGSHKFQPLDQSLFANFSNVTDSTILIDSTINYTDMIDEIGTNNVKVATSKTGRYTTLAINGGNIYSSNNFGVDFIKNIHIDPKNWSSIAISSSGKYQTAIVSTGEVWRSDDSGQLWFQIPSTNQNQIGEFNLNDISISSSGKYQTICGNGGNIIYSYDYGYNWTSTTICADNLISITMSDDGKYQSVCGLNGDSNSIMYSKTYGITWKYSNLNNSDIQWKSISCSYCGQYQTICGINLNSNFIPIMTSEDYGVNWVNSLSGEKNWTSVFVTFNGQRQLAFDYGGDIYLSLDFGYTWNSCYTNINNNWMSVSVSDTLQYIFILYNNGILISSIINDDKVPGVITVQTDFNTNPHAVILLSGSNSNIYSYETNFTDNFAILSSDLEDDGMISYQIISYGELLD